MAAASGCSLDLSRLAPRDNTVLSSKPSAATTATTRGLPSVSVPVLSTTRVSIFSKRSSASAFLISTPARCALADPHHDRHRGGEAEGAWAGDDDNRYGGDQRVGEGRRGRPDHPRDERYDRHDDHGGHEPGRYDIGEPLDRRAASLGLGNHVDDAREHGISADFFGPHHQTAGAVDRPANRPWRPAPSRLAWIRRSPSIHRRASAFQDDAIDRDAFARSYPEVIADVNLLQWNLFVTPVQNAPRGLRRQVQQRPDSAAGLLARAQFENLSQQHQHRDDGGCLIVDRDNTALLPQPRRKEAWREGRYKAVEIGNARCRAKSS